jgi:comEA protein
MHFFLSKSEQRALLLVALIIISAILIEWLTPHQINTKIYDYTLQDSLFKVLSSIKITDTLQHTASAVRPRKRQAAKRTAVKLTSKSININTASKNRLIKLPRIGPKIADRIIQYREANGRFKTIEDIKKVKGIGNKTFEKLSPYITTD